MPLPSINIKTILFLLMAFSAKCSAAQQIPSVTAKGSKSQKDLTTTVVKGRVLDYHSGKPVAHLQLQVKGTEIIKSTDAYGRFKFSLPDTLAGKNLVLNITPTGQMLLDSIGATIPKSSLSIDTAQLKNEVTIYRYPIGILPKVRVEAERGIRISKESIDVQF